MFEKAEIGVPCPECGHETNKTIAWLKSHNEMTCGGCGKTVAVDSKGLLAGLQKADDALAKFRKSLRGFGKRR